MAAALNPVRIDNIVRPLAEVHRCYRLDPLYESTPAWRCDMSVQQQQALDSLYALDNVVTIKITMSHADWDTMRTEEPAGGRCNFDWKGGDRYTWRKATSVEISGTSFPAQTTFTQVGIKKKSFCGSINSEKPCLHIDFGKFSARQHTGDRGHDRVTLCDAQ